MIADNKLALNAGWDPEILAIEMQDLAVLDLSFELEITGFETAEIDILIDQSAKSAKSDPADWVPPVATSPVLETVFRNMARVSLDGAIHFICMDWRHLGEVIEASHRPYTELKNLCIWNKTNGGMGSFYRSKHELVFVFKVGRASHVNTVELGHSGRYRTNVWDYAGVNTFRAQRLDELAMHPTVKPVALVCDAIKDCSRRGEIVLDPFAGSGTTIVAGERSGRRVRGIEIDPAYVDVCIRRWQKLTSNVAHHAVAGLSFDEVAADRLQSVREQPAALEKTI